MNVSELERVLSLDDIVGNLWKLGRTPSEDEFQKFLVENGLDGEEISDGLQVSSIPRVASLDLFRDLVLKNSASFQAALPGQNACTTIPEDAKNHNEQHFHKTNETSIFPSLESKPTFGSLDSSALGQGFNWKALSEYSLHAYDVKPVPAPDSNQSISGSDDDLDDDDDDSAAVLEHKKKNMTKDEIRRMRRMVSNRESARRSRRRKLEHVQCLDSQINQLKTENTALLEQLLGMEQRCRESMNENTKLKDEVENLKVQVCILYFLLGL
mmetsp:Transcript_38426/g.53338  ORF Transcript_38426/g.53338 Transcript_38426/m.53338 type:complete len:269 (+) Transcript_38426:183-989(+)